ASKMVRNNPSLKKHLKNNVNGYEVAFGMIGDASTSEGLFWETINAAGVLQVPMVVAVYDDGFGISVPVELQTTKSSISEALKGFQKEKNTNGIEIYTCKGWDYPTLVNTFSEGVVKCRETQVPAVFHITELTQPQGHSTSGSHERYKTKERLEWEKEYDGVKHFKTWLIENAGVNPETLEKIEKKAEKLAKEARDNAWLNYTKGYKKEQDELRKIIIKIENKIDLPTYTLSDFEKITQKTFPTRRSHLSFAKGLSLKIHLKEEVEKDRIELKEWIKQFEAKSVDFYNKQLYRTGADSTLNVAGVPVKYNENAPDVNGSEIINRLHLLSFVRGDTSYRESGMRVPPCKCCLDRCAECIFAFPET
ncbi:MAG: hypothetical protein LC658_07010, partial [Bacteroidales bacterium]|nr:hypothetical protein [Bacteroidales bacterium]